jgi:hypothetical protein
MSSKFIDFVLRPANPSSTNDIQFRISRLSLVGAVDAHAFKLSNPLRRCSL